MRFHKYHALGNDYLVLDPKDGLIPAPPQIERICHRNFGLGSDGILYGPLQSEGADFGLQIWNPDGSEAEKSGNGLRIFVRYLFDQQKVGNDSFSVSTKGGVVACRVDRGSDLIEVEMGRVSFHSSAIPVTFEGGPREVLNETLLVDGKSYRFCAATIGNPHVVLPLDNVSEELARELGPMIENNVSLFPNRTNVQFLKVLDRSNIQIEIWERGAGYTLASGTSSSAAASVARKLGLCDENIAVHCPGGIIQVAVDRDYSIRMTGPAARVGVFEMDESVMDQELPVFG